MAKTNSTTMVYESLKDKILRGVYSTSASLPEVELANEYNVSRNTIKKALYFCGFLRFFPFFTL